MAKDRWNTPLGISPSRDKPLQGYPPSSVIAIVQCAINKDSMRVKFIWNLQKYLKYSAMAACSLCILFRRDMRDFKVSVSIIEPTFFTTGMTQTTKLCSSLSETFKTIPQSVKDDYGDKYVEESKFLYFICHII